MAEGGGTSRSPSASAERDRGVPSGGSPGLSARASQQENAAAAGEEGEDERDFWLPCGHVFHKACITEWLERVAVCPVCKRDVATELVRSHGYVPSATEVEAIKATPEGHAVLVRAGVVPEALAQSGAQAPPPNFALERSYTTTGQGDGAIGARGAPWRSSEREGSPQSQARMPSQPPVLEGARVWQSASESPSPDHQGPGSSNEPRRDLGARPPSLGVNPPAVAADAGAGESSSSATATSTSGTGGLRKTSVSLSAGAPEHSSTPRNLTQESDTLPPGPRRAPLDSSSMSSSEGDGAGDVCDKPATPGTAAAAPGASAPRSPRLPGLWLSKVLSTKDEG